MRLASNSSGFTLKFITNRLLERFLQTVVSSDETAIRDVLREFVGRSAAGRFVDKLRSREKSMDSSLAKKLSLAIAQNGAIFPKEKGPFSNLTSTFSQAAILVAQLTRQVPAGPEREYLAREIVSKADPVPFALECFG